MANGAWFGQGKAPLQQSCNQTKKHIHIKRVLIYALMSAVHNQQYDYEQLTHFIVNDKIDCSMSFRAKRGILERFFVTLFLRMTKGNFH